METVIVKIRKKTLNSGDSKKIVDEILQYLEPKKNEFVKWESVLKEKLANEKLKYTPERRLILKTICNLNRIFCVDDIHTKSLQELQICRATVQNAVILFEKYGIIEKTSPSVRFGTNYFELKS